MASSIVPSGSPSPPAISSIDPIRELRFGDVSIDPLAGVVRRGGVPLVLRPKAYDVLLHFASHGGRLLSRLEVLAAVWPGVTVTDDSLVQCLVEIRRTLGDAAPITTVRGRGYRFDAEVEIITDVAGAASSREAASARVAVNADPFRAAMAGGPSVGVGRRWRVAGAGAALVAVLDYGSWLIVEHARGAGANDVGRPLGAESLNRDAIALHAEGQALLERQTRVSLLRAVDCFETASRLDPQYAGAWSGLSRALTLLHIFGSAASPTVLPRARAAALRSVELDPTLAEGHSALAHVLEQYDRDWPGAEASHKRAIALDPRAGRLHQSYALFLVSRLRVDEALAEVDLARARSTDPTRAMTLRGVVLMYAARPVESLAALDEALLLSGPASLPQYFRTIVLANLGRFDEALAAANAARVEAGNEPTLQVGIVHAMAGRRGDALEVRRALEQKAAVGYVPATDFALLAAAMGEDDEAVRWLERGAEERSRGIASMNVHPVLRRFRAHPGYVALLRRLDLPLP